MTEHICSRCGASIEDPTNNAAYVTHPDFTEIEEEQRLYALRHTDETRAARDEIVEENELNVTQANIALARSDPVYLHEVEEQRNDDGTFAGTETIYDHRSISDDDFEKAPTEEPVRPEDDPEVVRTIVETEEVEVQKSALVCKDDCVKTDDTYLW